MPLIAHWPLANDARDTAGRLHGNAESIVYADVDGRPAAVFDGKQSRIRIDHAPALRFGSADFTLTAWVRCQTPMTHALGDVASKFDPVGRTGINLHIAGSSPAYSAMSDQRHVHFGLDDGCVGQWHDLGKPEPTASHVSTLATWQGDLYAGIADAVDPDRACRVFRYDNGAWRDCGRLCDDPNVRSVQSMIVHRGKLYAGSGNWDWYRAKGKVDGFSPSHVHAYEYQGDQTWRDLGQVGTGRRVMAFGSFDGDLYAGMDAGDGGGRVYRFDGSTWHDCGAPDGANVEGFLTSRGDLYVATHGRAYRYDGNATWTRIAHMPHDINQIHCMAEVDGKRWLGTWPQGYVLRQDGDDWTNTGRLGIPQGLYECNEVMDLRIYNGKLYAALIPKAQVWRYESDGHWTLMTSLAARSDFDPDTVETWMRVTCLNAWKGKLCAATGTCTSRAQHQDDDNQLGRVHTFTAGQVASHEHDIGGTWTHITAVRAGSETRLYVNGQLSAAAQSPTARPLDLTNAGPLHIGYGPQTYFHGAIADVRLYDAALPGAEIASMA